MATFDSTDLDNAATESGVVHQSTANTDHNDASELKQGYDYANFSEITPTPVACYPLHEDSGTTAYDLAGTNNGTYNGPILGQDGLLGATAPSFDGGDDYIDLPNYSLSGSFTISVWSNHTSVNDGGLSAEVYLYDPFEIILRDQGDGTFRGYLYDGSSYHFVSAPISNGVWNMWTLTWDGSTLELYKNAVSQGTTSVASAGTTQTEEPNAFGVNRFSNGQWFDGLLTDARIYNTSISSTQEQTLYDVVNTSGSLTTQFKQV